MKIKYKDGSIRDLEPKVCENLVTMYPNNWEIVEDIEEPKKRTKKQEETNKDLEIGE